MNPIAAASPFGLPAPTGAPQRILEGGGSFANVLSGLVEQVNDLQTKAGNLREQMITGEAGDLHTIMIAAEEAGIAMELLIEVRNKLVEAYQDLLRMPV